MTCDQRDTGTPKNPVGGWSDSFYCNPAYDKLYAQQATELDPAQRENTVRTMQQMLYTDAPYIVLYYPDDLEAYNSAKWTGTELQPDHGGGAFFQYGLYTYLHLDVKANAPKAAGVSTGLIVGVVAAVVVVLLTAGFVVDPPPQHCGRAGVADGHADPGRGAGSGIRSRALRPITAPRDAGTTVGRSAPPRGGAQPARRTRAEFPVVQCDGRGPGQDPWYGAGTCPRRPWPGCGTNGGWTSRPGCSSGST